MSRKRTKTVIINHRDRELFSYLYEVKVATAPPIGRDIYQSVSKTVIYRRLKKLLSMKYLKRSLFFNGARAVSAYSLSKRGLSKFIFDKEDDRAIKRSLSNSIEHDIILNDIRHVFEGSPQVKDYFTENTLSSAASFIEDMPQRALKEIRPDGFILLEKDGQIYHMAMEYEHTLKYGYRYNILFGNYYLRPEISGVFYICRDQKILKRVSAERKKTAS